MTLALVLRAFWNLEELILEFIEIASKSVHGHTVFSANPFFSDFIFEQVIVLYSSIFYGIYICFKILVETDCFVDSFFRWSRRGQKLLLRKSWLIFFLVVFFLIFLHIHYFSTYILLYMCIQKPNTFKHFTPCQATIRLLLYLQIKICVFANLPIFSADC